MKSKAYQSGMTLIEIMIALLIGAFLLGGVLQIFVGSKQTNKMQEGLSRLQENGRFAMDFLAKDIRMAGYWGCISQSNANTDVAGTNNNAVNGDNIDNGTDTITLRGALNETLAPITGACGTRDIAVPGEAFYTHPSSTISYRINNAVLERTDDLGVFQDLIEGIENMQILYGVDLIPLAASVGDQTPNYYVTANNVIAPATGTHKAADWSNVVSIRISLLAATVDDNLTAQPVPYTYNGVTTTTVSVPPVTDRRMRRVFNATLAVRNRLP
jgi:type IV pilus assembly protein PilW